MDYTEDVEVLNEEIIVHPTAEKRGYVWKGSARVMGKVMINGETYGFESVISVTFKKEQS